MVIFLVGIYLIIGGLVMLLFADATTRADDSAIAYGFFWPITFLVGLVWVLTVTFRVFLKAIKSWNWHENS